MLRRLFALFLTVFLVACGPGGTPVTDFTSRSTIYAWVDVSDISGNHMFSATIRKYQPMSDAPFLPMGIEKFEGGYLIFSHAAIPGNWEWHGMALQTCAAIICGNTINEYNFGPFGSAPGKTQVSNPGVYYMGNFKMKTTKRGFFRPGEFDMARTRGGPSKSQLLAKLMSTTPEGHPIVAQRLQRARGR
jgi:hypothetical protein